MHFEKRESEKLNQTRKRKIQPIFSVTIEGTNLKLNDKDKTLDLYKTDTYIKHKNVRISIENVGCYPILNVMAFDQYLYQLLKPNERKILHVAYSDSPDIQNNKCQYLIELCEGDYERTKDGIPTWFNISYDDIDGNEMLQIFELKAFEDVNYYSLLNIEEV